MWCWIQNVHKILSAERVLENFDYWNTKAFKYTLFTAIPNRRLGSNTLLKFMKLEQMFVDFDWIAGIVGTSSFVFCKIIQKLPSCSINHLGTTAGVIMEVHWRISCLQIMSKYKTGLLENTHLHRETSLWFSSSLIQEIFRGTKRADSCSSLWHLWFG